MKDPLSQDRGFNIEAASLYPDLMSVVPPVPEGSYQRLRVLGAGGFGTAYLAVDAVGRKVVLKELHAERTSQSGQRFAFEAHTLTVFRHDNIVRVLQLGRWETTGRLFFAMELVDGDSFKSRIGSRVVREQLDNLAILRIVADAVAYAHDREVVHRDLKPDNVVIDQTGRPVVIDWGISARQGTDPTRAGSIGYMPPERIAEERRADFVEDVYSVGAMLYELLGGFAPYHDQIPHGLPFENARLWARYHEPTTLEGRVAAQLSSIVPLVTSCLLKDPRSRPSMLEVSRVLQSYARQCLCSRCHHLCERSSALKIVNEWVCGSCRMLNVFDGMENLTIHSKLAIAPAALLNSNERRELAATLAIPASLPQPHNNEPARGVSARDNAQLLEGIELLRVFDKHDGVESTLARDELGRRVVVEQLLPTASGEQRATFKYALDVLANNRNALLPRVLRAAGDTFVREYVEGVRLSSLDGEASDELLRALGTLCAYVLALHRSGATHGSLTAQDLLLNNQHEIVTYSWRTIRRTTPTDPMSPWMLCRDPTVGVDVTSVLRVVDDRIDPHGRWLSLHRATRELQQRVPITDNHLEQLAQVLDGLAKLITCHRCGTTVLASVAVLTGRGYSCALCMQRAIKQSHTAGDLHFFEHEQDALERRYRRLAKDATRPVLVVSAVVLVTFVAIDQFRMIPSGFSEIVDSTIAITLMLALVSALSNIDVLTKAMRRWRKHGTG